MAKLTVKQFIVCDDVRREATGKEILIGVYGSGISVPSFPVQIALSFWMQFYSDEVIMPPIMLEFQLKGAENEGNFFLVNVQLASAKAGLGTVALPPLPISLQIPTNLLLQMKQPGGEWETVGEIFVEKGAAAQFAMLPGFVPNAG